MVARCARTFVGERGLGGIGVITNPRSRRNRANPKLAGRLAYVLGDKGAVESPADLGALDEVAGRFRQRDIDVLCVNGGDGTLHKALTALAKAYGEHPLPKVALLRGGTMNTIAAGLGVKGSAPQVLGWVAGAYHEDRPMPLKRRWLMCVDGDQYGFLFGTGVIARFLEAYYESEDPSPWSAAWLLARAVASAVVGGPLIRRLTEPLTARVETDGEGWLDGPYMTVAAGTADDIGLGFRPFFRAPSHPGYMHAVAASPRPMDVVRELPGIYLARPRDPSRMPELVCQRLELRADKPISYMIDGDFHRAGQVLTVAMGPPVDFIIPDR